MAIYHFSAQAISRSDGRSATAAAAYRAGERIHDERTGQTFDYGRKSGVEHSQIMAPDNAPEWAHDRAKLWNAVEHAEKRKDSQVCREVEVSLPVELNHDQQLELVRGFVQGHFVNAGMVADLAIHRPKNENPHAHILLTMRDLGPDGFGPKNRGWNDKQLLEKWREQWAEHSNRALEQAGHSERIDNRTLEAQGIDRLPQIHLGPKIIEMEGRGIRTERGSRALAVEAKNEQIAALKSELEASENERNHENPAGPESRANRPRAGATGRELGDAGRPGTEQHPGAGERGIQAGPRVEHPAAAGSGQRGERGNHAGAADEGNARGIEEPARSRRGAAQGAAGPVLDDAGRVELRGHPRSAAVDRIVALAGPSAPGAKPARPGSSSQTPAASAPGQDKALDRSYLAARRQLDAMGSDSFDIGVRDAQGRMLTRTWTKAETLAALPWLKRENAKGADVYVRPAGEQSAGLVLVDDLNRGALARMARDGFAPASVTETSPDNFQAWVRVHNKPLPPEVATKAAQALAATYGGDPNSADWRHFGRLAGLTNAKPKHKDAHGRSPYVLAHDSSGQMAPAGPELVRQSAQRVLDLSAMQDRKARLEAAQKAPKRANERDPIQAYQLGLKALYGRFGASMDVSKADYMIGVDMVRRGFTAEQVGAAIEQASPELPTRKAGHEADYVARTVKAVMASPKVAEWQQEQAKAKAQRHNRRERDSGPSMGM